MLAPGTVVAGRFEIEREAGSGGMGVVYRARDRVTGDPVAIKVVSSAVHANRFGREAEVLSRLAHSSIVRHVAHGADGASAYLAMEWLDGVDLGARLEKTALTFEESIRLAAGAAGALAHAHAHAVVHRDVKPSNLFLRGGDVGRVAVLDFGVARVAEASRLMTGTGVVLGTPGYMAPEQARGDGTVDARADVFALGCVLFECLTGRPAFVGEHVMALLAKILFEETPRTRDVRADVPEALDALVARMMAKDPGQRPRDGAEVATALAALESAGLQVPGDRARAPTLATAPSVTGGEQRLVSVVMVRGAARGDDATLTPGEAEKADAELTLAIASHGGRLSRLADGSPAALLAGRGTAVDQAATAARVSLVVRRHLGAVAVAIATGRGEVGGRLPVGEAFDRAARMLHQKPAGADAHVPIQLDEMTRGLLGARFRVEGDEELTETGIGWEGQGDMEEGPRRLLGVATPCVGRERDIANLAAIFGESVSEPAARVVIVTAQAGVGKSRLGHELFVRLRRDGGDVAFWLARGATLSAGSPFGMLRQLVKRAARIRDAEPRATWAGKLLAHLSSRGHVRGAAGTAAFLGELIGADPPDAAEVAPLLRAAREDPALMGERVRRAFVDLVAAECAKRPVVLALEDLHWGDLPTVKAIDEALRSLHDQPLMVVALARPEIHEVFPRLWEERDAHTIRLGGLPRRAAEALATEVLGEAATASVVARIVERAGGNAFYLEELIRAVAEGRGDALPETVVAMMQTRLEGLPAELRRVLRAASVFGEVFWAGGVRALLGADAAPVLRERLVDLTDRELIATRREGRFGGEEEYVFRHALVREAAYAMLTDRDRVAGHRLAGDWLEGAGEREAIVLAEHFQRGAEPARAVPWFLRAAETAVEGGDVKAAIARAESGAVCGAQGETLGRLRTIQCEAYGWMGDFPKGMAAAIAALPQLPIGSETWNGVVGIALMGSFWMGRTADVDKYVEIIERQGTDRTYTRVTAFSRAVVVQSLLWSGRHERAKTALLEFSAIDRLGSTPEPAVVGWILWARLQVTMWFDADAGGALKLAAESVASLRQAQDARGVVLAMCFEGWSLLVLGAYQRAEEVLNETVKLSRQLGYRLPELLAMLLLAAAVARRGEPLSGLTLVTDALRGFTEMGTSLLAGIAHRALAYGWLLAGDVDVALSHAENAVALAASAPPFHAEALATLAQVLARRGDQAGAMAAARQAMAITDDLGTIGPMETGVRLVHAQSLRASGDHEAARAALARARDLVMTRATKIHDPELRRSFLEENRTNSKTLALAKQWLGPASP